MTTAKPQNLDWINSLRLIALFAVIVLHVSAIPLGQYGHLPVATWLTADFYNALVRFAVPVFVMITGALLLHREYELGDFLKKRLSRVVVPFLFWSLVYVGYSWYNEEITFNGSAWANIKQVLHQLKYGSSYHLWYVYMLIGLYFFIPVIGKFVRNATKPEIEYFLVMWLITMIITQPLVSRFNPQVDLHYFAGYAGYLVLGHYLTFNVKYSRRLVVWMWILVMMLVIMITGGTYLLYKYTALITLLYEPSGPAIALLASGVFLLGRFTKLQLPAVLLKAKNFACKYNFGIYLSHALVLYFLDDPLGISFKWCLPLISIPITAIICFILSLLLVWLLSRLPVVGKWLAGT
ncbi:acyltransferase [Mucilaginibacter sp. UR6-11]|uniref:acyltransferase n=1 Tax=Mucilaginibacter sp. UR6-11 TaxID=1435644 RepID=UPI001E398EBE|nr:acyltransferase family protein [Mucilaginibacter sp. UR6-11]MCC8423738.1 acyltransferase family protein [Mucilaginibacter sp. UR6-11]